MLTFLNRHLFIFYAGLLLSGVVGVLGYWLAVRYVHGAHGYVSLGLTAGGLASAAVLAAYFTLVLKWDQRRRRGRQS